MESLVGRKLGKYELTAMIGGGGMATVYEARHPGLDQRVAVKVLHPFLATDASFVDRFRREAHAVAAMRHPNIVRVLDSDFEGTLYYMVMEFIGGPTLSTVLSGRKGVGGLSLAEVNRIIPPLCSAVDYAAGRGMIHRDIKPANIILTDDGEPILTDYGIAKMLGSTSLTSPGTVVGSAHYMSPEQAQGQECDVRSDLYSLGVVLFECLAGSVPFEGDTTATVLIKHITAPVPSVRALRPNLPAAAEAVVSQSLAKSPRDRFESGELFAEALVLSLRPSRATAVITDTEVAAGAAMAAAAMATVVQQPPVTPPQATPAVTPPPQVTPVQATPVVTPPPMPPAAAVADTPASGETVIAAPPLVTPPAGATVVAAASADTPPGGATVVAPVASETPPSGATVVAPPFPPPPVEPPVQPTGAEPEQAAVAAGVFAAATTPTPHPPAGAGVPVGLYEQYPPPTPPPIPAGSGAGAPSGPRNRMRLILVGAVAILAFVGIGTAAAFALRGGSSDDTTTTTVAVTTTGSTSTTMMVTTTQSLTTTTMAPTTTTAAPTTTTVKPTTTTAKPTVTTKKKVTVTTKRPVTRTSTATTKRPVTTRPTQPPDTIGPGNTDPPDTIGPGG